MAHLFGMLLIVRRKNCTNSVSNNNPQEFSLVGKLSSNIFNEYTFREEYVMKRLGICLATLTLTLSFGHRAFAGTIDLTTDGASGTVNGAIFQEVSPQPTGTGVIQSFLRLQNNGFEQGYNTDYRYRSGKMEYDQKSDPNFTRSLLLSDVPVVNIDGVAYRQFLLDINESNGGSAALLSMEQLQIFQGGSNTLHDYGKAESNLGTKVYDLDANGNNTVLLNYDLNSGSGSGDMFAYIPDSLFDPSVPYVYLYSSFGNTFKADGDADAGFEEWAVLKGTTTPPVNEVPAPATLVFAAFGCVCGLVGYGRKRRQKQTPEAA